MALREYLVGEVAEDFADGVLSRREALRRLGLLGLGAAAAGAVLSACAAEPAAPPPSAPPPPADPPGRAQSVGPGQEIRFAGPAGELIGAWAAPAGARPHGALLVVHENRGLTEHFRDLVGRLAGAGYGALCVDMLSAQGGTAALTDPAQAPTALADTPGDALLADLRAGIDELGRRVPGAKVGMVGFCFGGGMTWQLLQAGEPRLTAAVPFYGPVPEQPDFSRVTAAVLAMFAGLDDRVNAGRERAEAAMRAAGVTHWIRTFEGADHAFFNDTGPRYDADAAEQAWTEMLDWFERHLA
ncbi:carboxymethylenebutenolidase [Pseudonocardia hierapolitana]|uniref:Carboxymethylenebutenolidase n=1 Tax=Pseudonocardia hierapolitana TaxID=1128676 RepID=A0A561SIM2_9PSEU|nr:dienelactone hydrolase family protein [Pseudonocardia hierapolitana]TWF74674.1 carboxymethylenebutenolidase [Pseudonocardia hierapolitana]